MNRAQRRFLARSAPHLLEGANHACQDGAHVLYHPGFGYLMSASEHSSDYADGVHAKSCAPRFHLECAQAFAERIKAATGLELVVRNQQDADAEGWR